MEKMVKECLLRKVLILSVYGPVCAGQSCSKAGTVARTEYVLCWPVVKFLVILCQTYVYII
jgi:hypothetical protein